MPFLTGFNGFYKDEASYEGLVLMHDYVTNTLRQKSIIIDADDLQADPGMIIIVTIHNPELSSRKSESYFKDTC